MSTEGTLRLVAPGDDERGPDALEAALYALLRRHEGMLPDDSVLLARLAPELPCLRAPDAPDWIDALVERGRLRRLHIGSSPHLGFGAETPDHEKPAPTAQSASLDAEEFAMQVQLDVEHERVVLYRVAVVIEGLVGLALLRSIALTLLGF